MSADQSTLVSVHINKIYFKVFTSEAAKLVAILRNDLPVICSPSLVICRWRWKGRNGGTTKSERIAENPS